MKKYTVDETSKISLIRRQKDTSPIPKNIMALLSTNDVMAGAQIEEFLSYLVSLNINMSFTNCRRPISHRLSQATYYKLDL
jgi:hypothetical protein